MYKQVFDYDGNAYLIKTNEEGRMLASDLKRQGVYQYTEIMPPSKLFPPRRFDGETWHGSSLGEQQVENKPNVTDYLLAQTQMQVAESSSQLRGSQKIMSDIVMESSGKNIRLDQLEKQLSLAMLEISEIKGGN